MVAVGVKAAKESFKPLERAQLHISQAKCAKDLFELLRKCSGHGESDKAFVKEGERLAAYEKKVRRVTSDKLLSESRPSIGVNIAAANRFIDHAIPDLTPEQRQLLRQKGDKLNGRQQQPNLQQRGSSKSLQRASTSEPNQLQADATALLSDVLGPAAQQPQ